MESICSRDNVGWRDLFLENGLEKTCAAVLPGHHTTLLWKGALHDLNKELQIFILFLAHFPVIHYVNNKSHTKVYIPC